MFREFFIAVLCAGLPVGVAAFALLWWALRKQYLENISDFKDIKLEVKRVSKDKTLKKNGDLVHKKWMAFGGGFYGVVGVLTYIVVELGEVRDFFLQFTSIADLLSRISLEMLIGLFVNALMNFIVAIVWPVYWMSNIQSNYIWIWFLVAYGGYWLGAKLALSDHATGKLEILLNQFTRKE